MDGQAPATTLPSASTQPEGEKARVSQPVQPRTVVEQPQSPKPQAAVTTSKPVVVQRSSESKDERAYKAHLRAALSAIAYAEGRGFDKQRGSDASRAVVRTLSGMSPPKHPDKRIAGKSSIILTIFNTEGVNIWGEAVSHEGNVEGEDVFTFVCENTMAAQQILYSFARDIWFHEGWSEEIEFPQGAKDVVEMFYDPEFSGWAFEMLERRIVGEK